MPGEFSNTFGPLIPNEGATARVSFTDRSVVLTPSLGSNRDRLNQKIQKEKTFRNITASVPGLYHPSILQEDPIVGRYEVERATGFNIASTRNQIHGGGMVEFFHIPTSFKTEAMLTYLRAIDASNRAGFCFNDHKADSVFIDPKLERISIVDADALEEKNKNIWERELNGGLDKVLRSFFTRGLEHQDAWTLVPAGSTIVIDSLKNYQSAHEVVQVLEGWMDGQKTISYGEYGVGGPQEHFDLLVRPLKSPEMEAKVKTTDFTHITDYQRDMLETEIYIASFFMSEEPQSIDKFSLGIGA